MKLNSDTVIIEQQDLQKLLNIAENIAKENNIYNVKTIDLVMDPTQSYINFSIEEYPKEIMSMYQKEQNIENKLIELSNIIN